MKIIKTKFSLELDMRISRMCVLRNYWLKALLNRSSAFFFEAAESLFEASGRYGGGGDEEKRPT